MPVSVIIGGQFGSEGKGKVALIWAKEKQAEFVMRCGDPNSGHVVYDDQGRRFVFRQLPTAALLPNCKLIIAAGGYIDLAVLFKEIELSNLSPDRLYISPNAVVIQDKHKTQEEPLTKAISSTGSGVGAAAAARIWREPGILAKDYPELKPYLCQDLPKMLRVALAAKKRILIEGTQGFGLSPLHSGYYPKVTSRDTTAAAFVSEAGLSPFDVDEIVLVLRRFPIRVAGQQAGELPLETSWEELTKLGQHQQKISEMTSVTQKMRRVADFDPDIVLRAIDCNQPTAIVLNHVDYVQAGIAADLNLQQQVIHDIENQINRKIDYIGLSPTILQKVKT